jgi:signal transduction histidine kinase
MAAAREAFDLEEDVPPRWRTVPFVLVILLACALGLIIYLADRAADERDKAIARQRHSFEVMMLANQLDGTIAQSETFLARYVVSLNKQIGRQFQAEWNTALAEVDALDRATRDNPEQQQNVKALKVAIDKRGKTLKDIALRTRYDKPLDALGHFYAAGKSPTISAMHDALKRTVDYEQVQLEKRNDLVSESERWMNRVYGGYGTVGVTLLAAAIMACWFAYGALRERQFANRLAEAEMDRAQTLDLAVRQRTEELQAANNQLRREMEERGRAEQSLRQLQKMEAIGSLTGGIAHDFNNMLAVVVSGIELARLSIRKDPARARRHLTNAMDGANRAAALTAQLLAFARPSDSATQSLNVDDLVLNLRGLIDRATDDGIVLDLQLKARRAFVVADPAQLESAILNLVINARDAMSGRGTLTIATRALSLGGHEIGQCAAGPFVEISVTDTGCGMSPELLDRVFEPFFTTKPVGKGTGLGLSQIFSFVRGAGGEIDIASAPGKGTTFRLLLQRKKSAGRHLATPDSHAKRLDTAVIEESVGVIGKGGGRLVLVVEDDARVRRATIAGLNALGYRCLSCAHPRRASALLSRHPETALILSDILMPDMTGPEMIASLGSKLGGRPTIFLTGYAGESEAMIDNSKVLRKPFTQGQLAHAIEKALSTGRMPEAAAPLPS